MVRYDPHAAHRTPRIVEDELLSVTAHINGPVHAVGEPTTVDGPSVRRHGKIRVDASKDVQVKTVGGAQTLASASHSVIMQVNTVGFRKK
jgi:hypothetical protein